MKILKRIIVTIFLLVLGTVILTIALLYKNMEIDTTPYEDATQLTMDDFEQRMKDRMTYFFSNSATEAEYKIGITRNEINHILKSTVFDDMSNQDAYISGENLSCVVKTEHFSFLGGNVNMKGKNIEIIASFHAYLGPITFKSGITLAFDFDSAGEEIIFDLTSLKIGNLSLLWFKSLADKMVTKFADKSIDELVNEMLGGIGEFSLKDETLVINIRTIIESQMNGTSKDLGLLFVDLICANDLIKINVENEELGVAIDFSKIKDNTTFITTQFADSTEVNSFISSKMSSLIISVLTTENPVMIFDEVSLNKLVGYYFNSFTSSDQLVNFNFSNIEVTTQTPYIDITDKVIVNIPIKANVLGDPANSFNTVVKFETELRQNGDDLLFDIKGINIGEITISEIQLATLLSVFGTNDLFDGNALVIKDFCTMVGRGDLRVNSFTANDGELILGINLMDLEEIDAIRQAVQDSLDALSLVHPSISDAVDDLLDMMGSGNQADIMDAANGLIGVIEEMSSDEQTEVLNDLEDLLEDNGYTLEEIFELFGIGS